MPTSWPIPEGTHVAANVNYQSEADIVVSLKTFQLPGESEKNVWAYWHTGWDNMPSWCQRNVVGWVRRLGPSWTVRVLDNINGSSNHFRQYLGDEHLPESVNSDKMSGQYAATHTADFLRLPLLYTYGGVWLDVGIILIRDLDDGVWDVLEDPMSPFEFAAFSYAHRPGHLSIINPWLASRKNCELVKRWHQTFLYIWGDSTECSGLSSHALLRHLDPWPVGGTGHKTMNDNERRAAAAGIMDYGTQLLCLERLLGFSDRHDSWDGRAWAAEKALLLPAMEEMWLYQLRTGFSGSKQFEYLNTEISELDRSKRTEAEVFVQDVLAKSMMMKLCHGAGVMESNLADFWDDPQHIGSDCSPDTFAGYLRWGSEHLKQNRNLSPVKLAAATKPRYCLGKFEPFPS